MHDFTRDASTTYVLGGWAPSACWSPRRDGSGLGGAFSFSSATGSLTTRWLTRLRSALVNGTFVMHYQPIVSLNDGSVCHHEALLRLADCPDGSLVPPGMFLPVAERSGLIREIDRMVLSEVIHLMGGPLADRIAPVAVNLSALSVTSEGTLSHIERLLDLHRVHPSRLILKLTETAAIADMGRAESFCHGVRSIGCAVALDDFGAGFGSFRYLKRLPFDYLKIDGDFIRALPRSRKDQLVVEALVRVAKGMGKHTIAEYVGDPETLGMLRAYGVDCAQGFEVGRPRSPSEAFAGAF